MDILSGINGVWLGHLTWIVAFLVAGLLLARRHARPDLAALGGLTAFGVANVAAGLYVFSHLGDGRWGGDAHGRLVAPTLAGTPMVGQFLAPIDALLSSLVEGANEFTDMQAALPVAAGFIGVSVGAFTIAVPVSVVALVWGFIEARRQKRAFDLVSSDVMRLNDEVAELRTLVGVRHV